MTVQELKSYLDKFDQDKIIKLNTGGNSDWQDDMEPEGVFEDATDGFIVIHT